MPTGMNVTFAQYGSNAVLLNPTFIKASSTACVTFNGIPSSGCRFQLHQDGNSSNTIGMAPMDSLNMNIPLYDQTQYAVGGAGTARNYAKPEWHKYMGGVIDIVITEGRTLTIDNGSGKRFEVTGFPSSYELAMGIYNGSTWQIVTDPGRFRSPGEKVKFEAVPVQVSDFHMVHVVLLIYIALY